MNKGNKQKLRKMYQIGTPISKLVEIFKVTENEIYLLCKGVRRL